LAIIIPSVTITASSLLSQRREGIQGVHLLHVSLLGLATSISFNGFITNFLKLLIGRPRPDLIARCLPASGASMHEYVSIAICTAKNLDSLEEGFKSAPSGHSSTSFAAFLFLSLWICGQSSAFKPGNHTYKLLLAVLYVEVFFFCSLYRVA
jgi:diacylglycerol diphosphate phosphatase/phosphatidate phosphatase